MQVSVICARTSTVDGKVKHSCDDTLETFPLGMSVVMCGNHRSLDVTSVLTNVPQSVF